MSDSRHPADILLVEDNPRDVRLIRELFDEQITNTLYVASDGDDALDFLYQRGEHADVPRPDIILLDWHLPGTSGEEVVEELEDDPDLNHIPIIVQTGSPAEADVIKSETAQANATITKPVEPDNLLDIVCSFADFGVSIVQVIPTPE